MKQCTFLAAILFCITGSLYSQIPQTISWQGILQDADSKNLSGTYSLTVKLYDVATGGTAIWNETHSSVVIADGLVNLTLGSVTPFSINFADEYWLEITVGSGTPLPRIKLSSVPYALHSKTAESFNETDPTWSGNANTTGTISRSGKVGIGTSSPTALLHIFDSETTAGDVLFVGNIDWTTPRNPPTSGAGTRMMWYPDKAAIRAGYVSGNHWDMSNIGMSSVAMGYNTIASDHGATAFGSGTEASGYGSTAFGILTTAPGNVATAFGNNTSSTGIATTATGHSTTASGDYSFSMGYGTQALGQFSLSMGKETSALSGYEVVLGSYNTEYVPENAFGWSENDRLFVIGNGVGDFAPSNAMTVLKNGKVGIGTENPTHHLDVEGQIRIRGGNPDTGKVLTSNSLGVATWEIPQSETDPTWTGTPNETSSIGRTGKVGIGIINPQNQLHINSWNVFSGILMTNDASGTTMDDGLLLGTQYQDDEPNNRYAIILNNENSKLIIGTNNNNAGDLTILPGGNTGIGTSTPSTRLDVNGQIRIRGGSPGTGKLLTSDAVGLASWQPVAISVDDNNFSGDGSSASPLKMKQMGASNGQVLKWNGSMWWPYNDNEGISLPYYEQCSTNVGFVIHNEKGIAVEGLVTSTTNIGGGTGVMGESRMDNGTGIYALASSTGSGTTYALRAESKSGNGFGLRAAASHTTGNNYGVWGSSASSQGHGVIGENSSSTGTTYGVRGIVNSSAGFSGFFTGGKFHVTGSVGIGTVNPGAGLHLKGSGFPSSFMYIESNTGQDAGLRIYEGSIDKWHIFNNSNQAGLQIYNTGGETAIFAKQSNAFVGLGTTAPTQKLDVNGNARFRSIGSGAYFGVVNRTSDGTLTTATSDIRFKENILTLENSLERVKQLRGVSFTWKSNPEYGTRIGFIAQEFEKVVPELVFTNPDDGFMGINYAEMTAVLVEAMKEQQTIIDEQNKRILNQQNEIDELKLKYEKLFQLLSNK
ncbi:MAG: tail fiber domain-containing protein [Desulfobulbaceae bacterium]|nr:tail fiber domain-containing protein [Desulfobulbaceae bacterium]